MANINIADVANLTAEQINNRKAPPVEGAVFDETTKQWMLNGEPITISQSPDDVGTAA